MDDGWMMDGWMDGWMMDGWSSLQCHCADITSAAVTVTDIQEDAFQNSSC